MKLQIAPILFSALLITSIYPIGFAAKTQEFNSAQAILSSKSNSKVSGTVNFTENPEGLKVLYHISGLAPNSRFGFHIHEKGDCSSKDAKSAGGHYVQIAPTGGTSIETPQKYAGDLPELKSDGKGIADGIFLLANSLSLKAENPIIGHAVIVHAGPDNVAEKSKPRIACGLIRANNTAEE